jgi:hypothetical protein
MGDRSAWGLAVAGLVVTIIGAIVLLAPNDAPTVAAKPRPAPAGATAAVSLGPIVPIEAAQDDAARAPDAWVYVMGRTVTIGRQPIFKSRGGFMLTKLIATCGELPDTDRSGIRVVRVTPTGRESTTIDLDDVIAGRRPDFELKADDLVVVPSRK